jgi:hypothetical protein
MILLLHYREKVIFSIFDSILKEGDPFALNRIMVVPVIIGQATPRQQAKWLPRTINYEIIVTYAQVRIYGLATLSISDSHIYGKVKEKLSICLIN